MYYLHSNNYEHDVLVQDLPRALRARAHYSCISKQCARIECYYDQMEQMNSISYVIILVDEARVNVAVDELFVRGQIIEEFGVGGQTHNLQHRYQRCTRIALVSGFKPV